MVTKGDITEIKSLSNPPQLVKNILVATMALLGVPNVEDYRYVKRALGDYTLLQNMSNIDIDSVSQETALKARQIVDGITEAEICKVSKATVSFLKWVNHVIAEVEKRTGDLSVATKQEPTA
ncbi:dynein axonemal heavy chain 10-like [Argopecten irradians]|uniref:dynein axonemal heavy chain 10-like n=1 Tax=Argopecten irradians TaxID=31199 RepID=UPI003723EDC1